MKRTLTKQMTGLFVAVFLVALISASVVKASPYLTDYQEALKKAGEENKEIVVEFYTDW